MASFHVHVLKSVSAALSIVVEKHKGGEKYLRSVSISSFRRG